jgi:O-antigen/teichoic acid export membrane protein
MLPSSIIVNELKKLLKQSAYYLAGLAASLSIGFISFPIFTRVFSVADYGTIDFVQRIVLLCVALSKMGQQNSALRFYNGPEFAANPEHARRYYSTMFYGMVATAAAVSLLVGVGMKAAPRSVLDVSLSAVVNFAVVLIFLKALESVLLSFMRIEEKAKTYAISTVSLKAATVAGVCFLLPIAGRSPHTFYSASVTVELILVAVFVVFLMRRGLLSLWSFDFPIFRAALAFGAPLIVYEIAGIILDSGDRVLVRQYLGADALGHYSVAYGLSAYTNDLLIAPLNLALLPIYMRLWRTEGRAKTIEFLSVGLDLFLMVAVGVFVLVAAAAQSAVTLLASSKYAGVYNLIPVIVAGLLIYTTHVFFAAGLIIHKNTRIMAGILGCSAAVNIGLNCLLLPRLGLQAAAIATLLSYLLCVALLAQASFKLLPLRVDIRAFLRYAAAAAVAWLGASQLAIASPILALAVRSITVCLLYGGTLYLSDRRLRAACVYLWSRARLRLALAFASVTTYETSREVL